MITTRTRMVHEAREAPQVVKRLLEANAEASERLAAFLRRCRPPMVVTCARGSSDHAAAFAKYAIEAEIGIPVCSAAPSIGSVYGRDLALHGTLFLAISQSGKSPDLVESARVAKRAGACVVALVNVADSPLAALADEVLPLHAGPEESVAATKTFIASLAAVLQLVSHWGADAGLTAGVGKLPANLSQATTCDWSEARDVLASAEHAYVVGRGFGFGVALEAALKFKETCRLHAEGLSAAELMHGPLALVREGFPVLMFSQEDRTRPGVRYAAVGLRDMGARVLLAEDGPKAPGRLPVVSGMHPACAPLAMIQSFYLMCNAVALARGLDPDHPPHLKKVTETT